MPTITIDRRLDHRFAWVLPENTKKPVAIGAETIAKVEFPCSLNQCASIEACIRQGVAKRNIFQGETEFDWAGVSRDDLLPLEHLSSAHRDVDSAVCHGANSRLERACWENVVTIQEKDDLAASSTESLVQSIVNALVRFTNDLELTMLCEEFRSAVRRAAVDNDVF